jgi:hypothetical protein
LLIIKKLEAMYPQSIGESFAEDSMINVVVNGIDFVRL